MAIGIGIGVGVSNGGNIASTVGGLPIGAAGTGIYAGYTLSWGDDFNALDILAPHRSRGKWWSTKTYLPAPRTSDGLLDKMYDTDPFHTGPNDSNRGVPVGFNNLSAAGSIAVLQARRGTAGEQAQTYAGTRTELGAMLSGAGAIGMYPDVAGTGDVICEWRVKFSAHASNPAGWHPTLWLQSLTPTVPYGSDEQDVIEGNSQDGWLNNVIWASPSSNAGTSGATAFGIFDGNFHTVTAFMNKTNIQVYVDGALYTTGAYSANQKSKPLYPLMTSHVYDGTYHTEAYSAAAWASSGTGPTSGGTISLDWIRVWRLSANSHYKPLASISDQSINFGGTVDIVLPSALSLWGDASVTEYVQAVMTEENEPGGDHTSNYQQFPAGVAYNSGTRTLTVAPTGPKAGRLNFVVTAYKAGATTEPLRFAVNVGPAIEVAALQFITGAAVSFDLYAVCDCGVLVTDGAAKTKTIAVAGLGASGLSYSDTTGLLTGTAVAGSYTFAVTVTNSLGQQASANIPVTVAADPAYAYEGWSGPGWFDASFGNNLIEVGNNVINWKNRRATGGDLSVYGTAAHITRAAAAQNGKDAVRLARDVSTTLSEPSLQASVSDAISTMCQGNDKPFTIIMAFKPTDVNTRFPWSWSNRIDNTNAQVIALVSRNGAASSVRRQLVTATPNDVNIGAGETSGTPIIVAVKHTGTAVSIWENSTTKGVNAAAQDTTTFNTSLVFRLGSSEGNGGANPTFQQTQGNTDYYEVVLENTARTDAEVQQAISDLATKWGITLV